MATYSTYADFCKAVVDEIYRIEINPYGRVGGIVPNRRKIARTVASFDLLEIWQYDWSYPEEIAGIIRSGYPEHWVLVSYINLHGVVITEPFYGKLLRERSPGEPDILIDVDNIQHPERVTYFGRVACVIGKLFPCKGQIP